MCDYVGAHNYVRNHMVNKMHDNVIVIVRQIGATQKAAYGPFLNWDDAKRFVAHCEYHLRNDVTIEYVGIIPAYRADSVRWPASHVLDVTK